MLRGLRLPNIGATIGPDLYLYSAPGATQGGFSMRQMLRPLLATALLAVATPVFAADQAAKANFGSQQITWEPQIAHESTVLTVSTPSGKVERHEFKGTPPMFELSNNAADGTYHWELQILPAEQPRHRRSQQGGEEPMAA